MSDAAVDTISAFDSPVVASAKLLPPRVRPESVPRTQLLQHVLGSQAQVVAITGPAGYGKSTLMAQCHAAEPFAAWLSLDQADNDPVVLWWAVIESIGTILDDFGHDYRGRLVAGGPAVVDEVVKSVANELGECRKAVRLFIDDLQIIEDEACRRSLHGFIRRLPDGVGVTVASRGALPVPLARQRVDGNLLEVTASELSMTFDEARHLLDGLGARLDPSLVDLLVARTEGWPAGLHLAGLVVASADSPADFVEEFRGTDRAVAEYLIEEVLERVSPDERRFMLETSVLRRLSGDLCDAVTGRTDSAEQLRSLEASNAMVIPLDRAGNWYRYHHLFADLLAARLHEKYPTDLEELHGRAFDWLREAGLVDDAIHHALAAGRNREAADLVCEHWWELFNTGRLQTARDRVERFDPDYIIGYPPLAIAAAFIECLAGDARSARRFIEAAEHADFDGIPPDGSTSMTSSLALARGSLALDGVDRALADGELAYSIEPPGSQWRTVAALIIGLARVMKGDSDGSTAFFEEANAAPEDATRAYALAELSLGHLARQDVEQAAALADDACRLVEETGLNDMFMAATCYAAAALAHAAIGDTRVARQLLAAASDPMKRIGQAMPMDAMRSELLLAEAALELGEYKTARNYANRATRVAATIADTGTMTERLEEVRVRLDLLLPDDDPIEPDQVSFTDRELEVLALIPLGLTTREIGEELFLSRNTIKTYLRRIYRKLDASSRKDALRNARRLGLMADTPESS